MLWNVKQAANYLGISNSLVYKMVSLNILPCVRLCNCIRFQPETIENMSRESKNHADESGSEMPIFNQDMNFNSNFLS
jgi:excisionase family DNA binding protein